MKRSIDWHKECLKNMRSTAQSYREAAVKSLEAAQRVEQNCIALDAQIIEAETRGVPAFDREKFGIKRTR